MLKRVFVLISLWLAGAAAAAPIDRQVLVARHSPTITAVDPASPLMVGNGSLAFTADITGLQTFQEQYSPLSPLLIESQWGWHSFPNPEGYDIDDSLVEIPLPGGGTRKYPALKNWDGAQSGAIKWLRENPHRFSLGRIGLYLADKDGKAAAFADLAATSQTLDLWTGRLNSKFVYDEAPVEVETSVHPTRDIVIVKLRSPLLTEGRAGVELKFPGVNATLNPNPADWANPAAHQTKEAGRDGNGITFARRIDDTKYNVHAATDKSAKIVAPGAHHWRFTAPGTTELTFMVEFSRDSPPKLPTAAEARQAVADAWKAHWSTGGVVDFTGSRDPRARELERRIVLSQYLAALNGAGFLPPQEEGLFSNSWNGKSHLEMHVWHSGHFAAWGRPELLERSMPWYQRTLDSARRRAKDNGVRGAWWPKMVGPEGRESPSTINPYIMWQQPHPIYLAELLFRAKPPGADRISYMKKYADVVYATADLLASWATLDPKTSRYVLGPPLVPAQENYDPLSTFNPTFELEYWRFGLETAQAWRERLGDDRDENWDRVLAGLSKLPMKDGLYVGAESQPDLWDRARAAPCNGGKAAAECPNRDHPSFVAALGYLPGKGVDRAAMARTLDAVVRDWDLRQTWGWDWPMLAMTAARLGQADRAVDFLLTSQKNFQFGLSGMTPRVHIVADDAPHAAGTNVDGPGYRRAAETYFPSNGSLLLAVALMVAGEGEGQTNPGFPKEGWVVRSEGIKPLP